MKKHIGNFFTYLKQSLMFTILNICLTIGTSIVIRLALHNFIDTAELFNVLVNKNFIYQTLSPELKYVLFKAPLWRIALAGFEDVVFVLPLLFLRKWKWALYPAMAISMVLFMLGHSYQGVESMLPKISYVPFAFWYASKYGISRTITGHAIQDVSAILLVRGLILLGGLS